jgi:CBS domain-containing protein
MLVKEIMITDVKTTMPNSTVQEAAKKMSDYSIGCLIVVDKGKLSGIVTERDMIRKLMAKGKSPSKTPIKSIMTKDVIMIAPDTDIEEASEVMIDKRIKKLPVLEKDNLIGIITAMDIVAAQPKLIEQISELFIIPGKKKAVAG